MKFTPTGKFTPG